MGSTIARFYALWSAPCDAQLSSDACHRYAKDLALNGETTKGFGPMRILRTQHSDELHEELKGQLEAEVVA